jgi:hypothetical protein
MNKRQQDIIMIMVQYTDGVTNHYNKSGDTWRPYFVIDCLKTIIEFDLW